MINSKKIILVFALSFLSWICSPSMSGALERDIVGVLSPPSQKYFNEVILANKQAWVARPDQKVMGVHLITTVAITVDENGVAAYKIHESSGNAKYDEEALSVCKNTKLAKPPETWNPKTRVGIVFSSRMVSKSLPEKIRDANFIDTVKTASSLRWNATKLPDKWKGKEYFTVLSTKVDKDGKQTFQLLSKSMDPAYDKFVMDTFKDTFIPTPPVYWDNSQAVTVEFSSKDAGTHLK